MDPDLDFFPSFYLYLDLMEPGPDPGGHRMRIQIWFQNKLHKVK
jgi:hypothetical protein